MSEMGASGASEGTGSSALAVQTNNRLVRRIASLKRYWLYSRLLATAGALLVAVAAWLPWVSVRVFNITSGATLPTRFQLDPGDLATDHYGGLFWGTLTVAGLLIVPFLWRHPSPGWRAPVAPLVYTGWVLVLLPLGSMAANEILQFNAISLAPELRPSPIGIGGQQLLAGYWLGGAALVAPVLATLGLLLGLWRIPVDARDRPPARSSRRPAIGALVFGVLLFWLGTLMLPWATVNCTAMPLFFGQCTGLPFSGVLANAIRVDVPGLDPLAAIYSANILLSGGALLVLIAIFLGARSRFFAFWTTIWLLVAMGFVALASVGVRLAASQPAQLGLPPGSWSGDMGIFVTLLALGLGWIGAGGLWLSRQRSAST
jgi:hypothetical protein